MKIPIVNFYCGKCLKTILCFENAKVRCKCGNYMLVKADIPQEVLNKNAKEKWHKLKRMLKPRQTHRLNEF